MDKYAAKVVEGNNEESSNNVIPAVRAHNVV